MTLAEFKNCAAVAIIIAAAMTVYSAAAHDPDAQNQMVSGESASGVTIDFGNNSGRYSHDNECDDARFVGPGAQVANEHHIRKDASDCKERYEEGYIAYISDPFVYEKIMVPEDFNFGDNSSIWAFDEECDDPRFSGPGMASDPRTTEMFHDAYDCLRSMWYGEIRLKQLGQ